jgi:hypothetical protein
LFDIILIGEKYIWNGILFKFAIDWKDIYGDDEYAMKAAGHELKSLMQILNLQLKGLYVPLITLVTFDYDFEANRDSIFLINYCHVPNDSNTQRASSF